jgi:hypothetical protein
VTKFNEVLRTLLSILDIKWLSKNKYERKKDYLEKTFFEYERRKEYLEGKFPEIASKKGGNRRVTNKGMKGGNIYKDAQRTEVILRSAFAILYAAWEDGQEWVDSKKEKWGKEKLARLYNRFKESQVSDNQTKELVTGGDSPYAYYIPFVKKQIEDANIPDLTWMYQTLLNNEKERKEIRIPTFIQHYLNSFLESKRSTESFLEGLIRSASVKRAPVKESSIKPKSTLSKSAPLKPGKPRNVGQPVTWMKTIANLPKLISKTSMASIPQIVSAIRRGGRHTHKKMNKMKKMHKTRKRSH